MVLRGISKGFLQLRNTKMSSVSFKLFSESWMYYKRLLNGFCTS